MSSSSKSVPEAGDILLVDLNPAMGGEQCGKRSVIVISPSSYNGRTGLAKVVPLTTRGKGYPFEVEVTIGVRAPSWALADQDRPIDWVARNVEKVGRVDIATLNRVKLTMAKFLSIPKVLSNPAPAPGKPR